MNVVYVPYRDRDRIVTARMYVHTINTCSSAIGVSGWAWVPGVGGSADGEV